MSDRAGRRERLLLPLLIPLGALVVIGFVLFLFSRILLDVSHTAATVVALLVAGAVMAIAGYVSTREHITQASLWSMAGAVLGVGMLIGGVAMLVGQPGPEEEEPFVLQIAAPPDAATDGFEVQTLSGPGGRTVHGGVAERRFRAARLHGGGVRGTARCSPRGRPWTRVWSGTPPCRRSPRATTSSCAPSIRRR